MNRRTGASVWGLMVVAAAAVACGGGSDAGKLTELQRVRSGMLDIVLLSPRDGLRHGKDTFIIEFRSGSGGSLVDVGNVRGNANMPMPGAPMFASVDVKRTDLAGRYEASGDFSMAGTWRMTLQWEGPAGQGSVSFPATVSSTDAPRLWLSARSGHREAPAASPVFPASAPARSRAHRAR